MQSVPRVRASVASLAGPDAVFDDAAWRSDVRVRALERRHGETGRPDRLRRWAWLLAIVIHLLVVTGLRIALRRHDVPVAATDFIRVELIDTPRTAPPLPEPAPLPQRSPAPRNAPIVARPAPREIPAPTAVQEAKPPAVDELRLFNQDGSANVPDDLAAQIERNRPKPDFIAHDYSPSPILQAKRPLKVRPNHFAGAWAGPDGKPLHETIFDSVTVVREFTAPWGGRYGCAWILIIVACADVPDKPWIPPTTWKPATEQDEY